jgi:predicted dehydrogenase
MPEYNFQNPVRIGLIGMGYMGRQHLLMLKQLGKQVMPVEINSISDTNEESLKELAVKYNIVSKRGEILNINC